MKIRLLAFALLLGSMAGCRLDKYPVAPPTRSTEFLVAATVTGTVTRGDQPLDSVSTYLEASCRSCLLFNFSSDTVFSDANGRYTLAVQVSNQECGSLRISFINNRSPRGERGVIPVNECGIHFVDYNFLVPAKLAFVVQPSTASAASPITPPVQVAVQDVSGNTVTTGWDWVTLAFGANPGAGTLSGTLTVQSFSGIARFRDLQIDQPGAYWPMRGCATSGCTTFATLAPPCCSSRERTRRS